MGTEHLQSAKKDEYVKGLSKKAVRNRALVSRLKPLLSSHRISDKLAAGDRIRHRLYGNGIILSISPVNSVFAFDLGVLKVLPTRTVGQDLIKILTASTSIPDKGSESRNRRK